LPPLGRPPRFPQASCASIPALPAHFQRHPTVQKNDSQRRRLRAALDRYFETNSAELPFLPGMHNYDTHPFFKEYSLTKLVQDIIDREVTFE